MGLLDEAHAIITRLREITSEAIPKYLPPYRNPLHRELLFSGLRLAMGGAI
jgi:hypothetical protein